MCNYNFNTSGYLKKPLARVSQQVIGAHGKGWQKRLAKGWRKFGEGLAQGWSRVGECRQIVAERFLAPSNFAIPQTPAQKSGFVTPWLPSFPGFTRCFEALSKFLLLCVAKLISSYQNLVVLVS